MKKLLFLAVTLVVLAFAAPQTYANQLTGAKLYQSVALPSTTTTHKFGFTITTSATIKSMKFEWCNAPSGGCTRPNSFSATSATLDEENIAGSWTIRSASTTQGALVIHETSGAGQLLSGGDAMNLTFGTLSNPSVAECNPVSGNSSGTCYALISTYTSNDASGTATDVATVSFTIVANVSVSARVDPTFSFTVGSVPSGQVDNGITTSVASDFNSLAFGNLTANAPKYAAQKLNVTTNTQGGYIVELKVNTPLTGVYAANNIDPFTADWATPATWTIPQGTTPNDNTGWIGANTTDTDVTGWSTASAPSGKFGGISSTPVTVMKASSSDNGSYAIYVSYGIEASVFQPADTYSGALNYNALPTY